MRLFRFLKKGGELEVPPPTPTPAPSTLAMVGFFKNEAPYLQEWIEFYRLLGAETIYLYNNNSTDKYRKVLGPYLKRGIVRLHRWPRYPGHVDAYNHCLKTYGSFHRWMGFVDLDEFLFPLKGDSLTTLLAEYEEFAALAVHWVFFGTSGHILRPKDAVTKAYLRSQGVPNRHVKLLLQPSKTVKFTSSHVAEYKDGLFAVNERKERVEGAKSEPATVERVRINHYWTRSVEDFLMRKMPNGISTGGPARAPNELLHAERKYDVVEDTAVLRFVPRLLERMQSPPKAGN